MYYQYNLVYLCCQSADACIKAVFCTCDAKGPFFIFPDSTHIIKKNYNKGPKLCSNIHKHTQLCGLKIIYIHLNFPNYLYYYGFDIMTFLWKYV